MSSLKIELEPCPCCGGEARFETYHVEDGYVGHEAGDIICLDCGLRTISAPVDGYCGVEWTEEDFAARWNRRAKVGKEELDRHYKASRKFGELVERILHD